MQEQGYRDRPRGQPHEGEGRERRDGHQAEPQRRGPSPPRGEEEWQYRNPIIRKYAAGIHDYGRQEFQYPYARDEEDEGDEYYRDNFPFPFNQPPPPNARAPTEFRKMEGMAPKFSGRENDFPTWVSTFCNVVHKVRCPVTWKALLLNGCLDLTNPRLKEIHEGAGTSRHDYIRTVSRLMRAFGHPQGMLAARREALNEITLVRREDFQMLEKWYIRLETLADSAKALGRDRELADYRLYQENVRKMEPALAQEYYTWCKINRTHNDAITLLAWLDEAVETARKMHREAAPREERRSHAAVAAASEKQDRPRQEGWREEDRGARRVNRSCPLDGERHGLAVCEKFRKLDPFERREKLREWKRCYACLAPGHNIRDCTKGVICQHCQHKHHTLLHGTSRSQAKAGRTVRAHLVDQGSPEEETGADGEWSEDSAPESDPEDEPQEQVVLKAQGNKTRVALQTLPVRAHNGRHYSDTNLLIDQGATGAFISKRLAEDLGLVGHMVEATVTGFDGVQVKGPAVVADLQISAQNNKKRHWIQVQVSADPAGSYKPCDWTKLKKRYQYLKDVPVLPPVPDTPVDILLGMDAPHLVSSLIPDVGGETADRPIARKTRLGWVIAGPTGGQTDKSREERALFVQEAWVPPQIEQWSTFRFGPTLKAQMGPQGPKDPQPEDAREPLRSGRAREDDMHHMVARMWEVDAACGKPASSPVDDRIFDQLREHLTVVGGRYQLPTLWKKDQKPTTNNYTFALGRLRSLLKSGNYKQVKVQEQYEKQMVEWEQEGYVEEVRTATPATDQAFYLPHFPVVRLDKTSTQVRIVMDAAARPAKGKSLNDCLHKGPKLVNELITVLMRFRMGEVTLAADIKKMFYQIVLHEDDRDFHRFLWMDHQGDVRVYRWRVHPFGSAASPCIAIFTIKEHARRWKHLYPQAAETVIHSTLVDDNLDSVHTPEEAIELGRQLVELFRGASMKLGKIASNSREVLAAFPAEMVATSLELADFCTKDLFLPLVKALGIIYLCETDEFSFRLEEPERDIKWTKRQVLRYEAKLYDPHGLISPHTGRARIVLQKLWRKGLGWDDALPPEERREWDEWLEDTQKLPQLRIPRGLSGGKEGLKRAKVHVFADASADAYAAAAYLVGITGEKKSRLMISKIKVAPIHMTSIPRLELLAAMLAVNLAEAVVAVTGHTMMDVHFWTDSRNVLSWIQTDSRSLHTFVGTRVAKIQQFTLTQNWRWVDSPNNPADIPSRGMRLSRWEKSRLWWNGPEFLTEERVPWPEQPEGREPTGEAMKEVKKGASFALCARPTKMSDTDGYSEDRDLFPIKAHQVSGWERLLRVIAWCRRVRKSSRRDKELSADEIRRAEVLTFRAMQAAAFARTLREMTTQPFTLTHHSQMRHLAPVMDKDGVVRRTSRLAQLHHVPYGVKHQVVLPKDHPLVPLLVQYVHEKVLHAGPQLTLAYLMKSVWILKGSALVRRVVASCIICRRKKAKPAPLPVGPLPETRVPPSRVDPFAHTAIDAAGPFTIKESSKAEGRKAYFVLFTCMVYRAIHLEPIASMTTNAFLNALQRFTARRGVPTKVLSDNGSNFVAADSELKKLWDWETREKCKEQYPQIEWEFIPPYSPHFGGVYERLVQATKNALYHTFKPQQAVTQDQFHTALVVVEGILNSRPLTYRWADEDAPEPLTPADFLATGPYREMAMAPGTTVPLKTRWRFLQQRLNYFWKRFQQEVVPYLQAVTKSRRAGRNIQVGDVVVFLDGSRRGAWPLAKVLKVEESKDGIVRKLNLLSKGTTYRRAAEKVMLLLPNEDAGNIGSERNAEGNGRPETLLQKVRIHGDLGKEMEECE